MADVLTFLGTAVLVFVCLILPPLCGAVAIIGTAIGVLNSMRR